MIDPDEIKRSLGRNADYSRIVIIGLAFILLGGVFYHYVEHLTWLDQVLNSNDT